MMNYFVVTDLSYSAVTVVNAINVPARLPSFFLAQKLKLLSFTAVSLIESDERSL